MVTWSLLDDGSASFHAWRAPLATIGELGDFLKGHRIPMKTVVAGGMYL